MINVSDLNKHSFCSRTIYLANYLGIKTHESEKQKIGIIGHAIRKELSLRQSKLLKKSASGSNLQELMRQELDSIILDAPYIYKEKLPKDFDKHLPQIKKQVEKEIEKISKNLEEISNQMGFEKALKYITPWKVEYELKNKKLDLTGRIDKIYKRDTTIPVEIKTGKVPRYVWEGDKIQVTAYVMMLEENLNEEIPFSIVEYTQALVEKNVLNTEKNRRQVIYIRDEIQEILSGVDPGICPHGNPKKCESCALEEVCYKT